jgi:hypothetical protein
MLFHNFIPKVSTMHQMNLFKANVLMIHALFAINSDQHYLCCLLVISSITALVLQYSNLIETIHNVIVSNVMLYISVEVFKTFDPLWQNAWVNVMLVGILFLGYNNIVMSVIQEKDNTNNSNIIVEDVFEEEKEKEKEKRKLHQTIYDCIHILFLYILPNITCICGRIKNNLKQV